MSVFMSASKALFFSILVCDRSFASQSQEVSMGTTILSVKYRDGVVVGADTRTSVSGYVSNRYATKVSFVLDEEFDVFAMPPSQLQYDSALYKNSDSEKRLTESRRESDSNIISSSTCCISRSGSAADTQNLANIVRQKLHARKITHRVSSTISDVAHLLKNLLNTGSLTASLICSGYDHSLDRGVIYAIDIGGTLMEQDGWACSGSGSSYILGYVDANYPKDSGESPLWSEEEAVEFVGRAIELAMDRDGSSGGFVRIFVINRDGKKQICRLVGSQYENGSEKSGTVNERNLSNFAPPIR